MIPKRRAVTCPRAATEKALKTRAPTPRRKIEETTLKRDEGESQGHQLQGQRTYRILFDKYTTSSHADPLLPVPEAAVDVSAGFL